MLAYYVCARCRKRGQHDSKIMANHSEAGRMRHGVVVGVAPRCAVEEIQYDAAAPAEAWKSERDSNSDTVEFEIIDWI